jgi:hypothetical protein
MDDQILFFKDSADLNTTVKVEDKEGEEPFNPADYENLNGKTEVGTGTIFSVVSCVCSSQRYIKITHDPLLFSVAQEIF